MLDVFVHHFFPWWFSCLCPSLISFLRFFPFADWFTRALGFSGPPVLCAVGVAVISPRFVLSSTWLLLHPT